MTPGLPIFFRIVFGIFGMIGLTTLISMWTTPFNSFGSPPIFFRIFASFIGLAFMAFGFGVAFSKAPKLSGNPLSMLGKNFQRKKNTPKQYECPHCAGGIGDQEVSPSGDVKCAYCGKWYNVHA